MLDWDRQRFFAFLQAAHALVYVFSTTSPFAAAAVFRRSALAATVPSSASDSSATRARAARSCWAAC